MITRVTESKLLALGMESVLHYGVVDDAVTIDDAVIASTSGNAQVSSVTHTYTAADVGKLIDVTGAGAGGTTQGMLSSTIVSVASGKAVLGLPATSTVNGVACSFGTDNQAAFQAAINAALGEGRTLAVAPTGNGTGVYMLGDTLAYANGLHIRGFGNASMQKWGGSGGHPIIGPAVPGSPGTVDAVHLSDLRFVGEGKLSGFGGFRTAVQLIDATNVCVERCSFRDFTFSALEVSGGGKVWIVDNDLTNCCTVDAHNAIDFASGPVAATMPTELVIRGNRVQDCDTSGISISLQTAWDGDTQPQKAVITGNVVQTTRFAPVSLECGSTVGGSTGTRVRRVIVANNVLTQTGASSGAYYGLAVADTNAVGAKSSENDQFKSIIIAGNEITSADSGILAQASSCLINGNVITATYGGIWSLSNGVNAPRDVVIANNLITLPANANVGINVQTAHSKVSGNNVVYAEGSNTTTGKGILVYNVGWVTVNGNNVEFSPGHGIEFSSANDFICFGNSVLSPSDGGTDGANGINLLTPTVVGAGSDAVNIVKGNTIIDNRGSSKKMDRALGMTGGSAGSVLVANNAARGYRFAAWATVTSSTLAFISNNYFTGLNGYAPVAISPTGSPYTYTFPQHGVVTVSGGTVSDISRAGRGSTLATGVTAGDFHGMKGDTLIVTYSSAPTMNFSQDT